MVEEESDLGHHGYIIPVSFILFIIFSGAVISKADADTIQNDREILLQLKSFLEEHNKMHRGKYSEWNRTSDPCAWNGISCDPNSSRVVGVNLSSSSLNGEIFGNFSGLTALEFLDISSNTLSGQIPADLGDCRSLKHLNLSHNNLGGELNFTGLESLEVLDLSLNKIGGGIRVSFPGMCRNLRVLNISTNQFNGSTEGCFDGCLNLEYVDLSANNFTGPVWAGLGRVREFNVGENNFTGSIMSSFFGPNCTLESLDLSENVLSGEFPGEVSNCRNLTHLVLGGNEFSGDVPRLLGSLSGLKVLILGGNRFTRRIPDSLLNCAELAFLDLSTNNFGGEVPVIFGKFTQLKVLVLHNNSFTGGLNTSGIMNLPNLSRLDLSYNNFSGPIPTEVSRMDSMQYLDFAFNQFSGPIPPEIGNLKHLQALDLSFNNLSGSIPPAFGNLKPLLWLMLANNSLTGKIPPELGNCTSLLWLNLANNLLHGEFPPELAKIGSDPMPTFLANRQGTIVPGSGECLAMKRWIPANYPPFSFAYNVLTRKSCRSIWDRILKGYGLFPICSPGTKVQTFQISGYLQLTGNRFSGKIPPQIGQMRNFSMLHFSNNAFEGELPSALENLPLVFLNVSQNNFSGVIPAELGNIYCLLDLDLSLNNFSGVFPTSLDNLFLLNKFNVSFNPNISGVIPSTGQLATFEKDSFLGDPRLILPSFIENSTSPPTEVPRAHVIKRATKLATSLVVIILLLIILICGAVSFLSYTFVKGSPSDNPSGYLLKEAKCYNNCTSTSNSCCSSTSSPWLSDAIKVIRLDKTGEFTHSDIVKATGNFSEDRIVGRGGFGTVYKGVLPDGRQVAVKKLQREGLEGEREFRAEMQVLTQDGVNWPHPNLVNLYGWCLDGAVKLLVYEYMEGGTLEDFISDRLRLPWKRRVEIAIDVARALVFLHHECYPPIVHRDVKASNVLLDRNGKARVTDFGLARVVDAGGTHVSTAVAGTVGYVAPEYSQTWHATTKGDVYSFGVLAMELATARRAVNVGEEECLVEWARRVVGENQRLGLDQLPGIVVGPGENEGAQEMGQLLSIGIRCTAEAPQGRPNMKEVLNMLVKILGYEQDTCYDV